MSYITSPNDKHTGPAAAAYSAAEPRFATIAATTRYITRNTSAGGVCDGVVEGESSAAGDKINLVRRGEPQVEAGDVVGVGQEVMSDNVGRAVPATATNFAMGKATTAATAAGQLISVLLGNQRVLP